VAQRKQKLKSEIMKMLTSFIALLLLTSLTASAEIQRADTKESLRGLDGVYLITQMVDEQPEGMTTNSLLAVVVAALTDAGIPTNAVPKKFNGDANLSITVDILKQPQLDVYVFTVEVVVTQDVKLTRLPHAEWSSSETWRRTIQGITSPDRTDVIEQALKKCVDAFVADYRAVNPKPAH
jgi:hypothetical protein